MVSCQRDHLRRPVYVLADVSINTRQSVGNVGATVVPTVAATSCADDRIHHVKRVTGAFVNAAQSAQLRCVLYASTLILPSNGSHACYTQVRIVVLISIPFSENLQYLPLKIKTSSQTITHSLTCHTFPSMLLLQYSANNGRFSSSLTPA